jgi:hypothetical protein
MTASVTSTKVFFGLRVSIALKEGIYSLPMRKIQTASTFRIISSYYFVLFTFLSDDFRWFKWNSYVFFRLTPKALLSYKYLMFVVFVRGQYKIERRKNMRKNFKVHYCHEALHYMNHHHLTNERKMFFFIIYVSFECYAWVVWTNMEVFSIATSPTNVTNVVLGLRGTVFFYIDYPNGQSTRIWIFSLSKMFIKINIAFLKQALVCLKLLYWNTLLVLHLKCKRSGFLFHFNLSSFCM